MSRSPSTASTLNEDSKHVTTNMTNRAVNLADPVLLEKIDKFFELGIGVYVALPQVRCHPAIFYGSLLITTQLLVVGDQSR